MGVKQTKRSGYACATQALFKSWLVGALGTAVALLVSGSSNWQTIVTTTATGGSIGFFVAGIMDKDRSR